MRSGLCTGTKLILLAKPIQTNLDLSVTAGQCHFGLLKKSRGAILHNDQVQIACLDIRGHPAMLG